MTKEDVYRELAERYKWSRDQIASLSPTDQWHFLQSSDKSPDKLPNTETFANYEEYLKWRTSRKSS